MNRKVPKWVLPLFGALAGIFIDHVFLLGFVTAQERGAGFWFLTIFSMIQFLGAWLLFGCVFSLGRMKERAYKTLEQRP
ncbi:hypothetical protein BJI49_09650 [Acetobacter pasteurianus]|uniref:hypothetical protein n=1 Tax=Acetobacter pasteurianus TaxID=438 RepID=UPI000552617F|nr:hypothetical protein [Acetobacter pasteurianus]RCL05785.1 hypothetical protein BJI49_09650 [Acetobacter pasteurianus]GCD50116.1 hypothetical protein NBRC106471_1672 [Acetobacter pasteurianus subsp. pasteurianus LMG 1262 = NBRC 106471]